MGDVLVSSTILPLLKNKYPNAEISFLLDEKHHQILIGNPYLDHFIFWNHDNFSKMLVDIRKQKFDIVIDLYSKIDTGFLTLFSGAKKRIGFFKKYTQLFYNSPIIRRKKAISSKMTLGIEHRLQLLEPLDISFQEVFPKIHLSKEELEAAEQNLNKNGLTKDDELIMISTFGSTEEKTYPLEYMAETLNYIVKEKPNSKILCNYMPHQKVLFEELYDQLEVETKKVIVKSYETKNLRELAIVTSFCKCLIGNEGGATNLSKSLGIPTFTIFAPQSDPEGWAWTSNSDLDRFLHLNDFVKNSKDYMDFKPEFLEQPLKEFLEKITKEN